MVVTSTTASCGLGDLVATSPDLAKRTTPMTIEILYLTAQIHRWLDRTVARHLAAQAARFSTTCAVVSFRKAARA